MTHQFQEVPSDWEVTFLIYPASIAFSALPADLLPSWSSQVLALSSQLPPHFFIHDSTSAVIYCLDKTLFFCCNANSAAFICLWASIFSFFHTDLEVAWFEMASLREPMIVLAMRVPLSFVPCNETGLFHLLLLFASADPVVEFSAKVFFSGESSTTMTEMSVPCSCSVVDESSSFPSGSSASSPTPIPLSINGLVPGRFCIIGSRV